MTGECNLQELQKRRLLYHNQNIIATIAGWFLYTTTSTLRLPLYILSAVDAYQKAYGTGKNVMLMLQSVLMYCVK